MIIEDDLGTGRHPEVIGYIGLLFLDSGLRRSDEGLFNILLGASLQMYQQ